MKIPYRAYPDSFGPPCSHLYIVILEVQIALAVPNAPRTKRIEALIDSGATRTLFHADLATHLGLDLRAGAVEIIQGIGGRDSTYLHEVILHLPGGAVKTRVGFKENLPIAGLLGMSGFLSSSKSHLIPIPGRVNSSGCTSPDKNPAFATFPSTAIEFPFAGDAPP